MQPDLPEGVRPATLDPPDAPSRDEAEWRRWIAAIGPPQRLRLGGLPTGDRVLVLLLLLLLLATAAVLVAVAAGVLLPGGDVHVPGRLLAAPGPVPVPILPAVLLYVGGAIVAVAIGRAGGDPPRSKVPRVAAALGGIFVAARSFQMLAVRTAADADLLRDALVIVGILVVAFAAVAAVAASRLPSRVAVPLLAAPFLYPLLVMAAGGLFGRPDDLLTALVTRSIPGRTTFGVDVGAGVASMTLVYLVPVVLLPYLLWQAATWARASRREIGIELAGRLLSRWTLALPALLAAKTAWLVMGYLGLLPVALGGANAVWASSLSDGPIGWLLAAIMAAILATWLLHPRRVVVEEAGLGPPTMFAVVGFTLAPTVVIALLYVATVAAITPASSIVPAILEVGNAALATFLPAQALTVLLAGVLGIAILIGRGPTTAALFLVVFAAWALPRATAILLLPDDAAVPAAVEIATLDALLTGLIVVLAVLWHTGRQQRVAPPVLALVVIVSTMLAHGGTVVPPAAAPVISLAGLLFPVVYLLGFDASALNEPFPNRPGKVLRRLAGIAAMLLVIGSGLALGGAPTLGSSLGVLLFAVPFTTLLVGATISRTQPTDSISARSPARSWSGASVAALALVAIAGLTVVTAQPGEGGERLPVVPPAPASQSSPILDGQAYAAAELGYWFQHQVVAALAALGDLEAALGPTPGSVRDEEAVRRAAAELERAAALRGSWIIPDREAGCALEARSRHIRLEETLYPLALAARDHADMANAQSEGPLRDALEALVAVAELYVPAVEQALADCPGVDVLLGPEA